jgi:prolyl oligopeptidase
MMPYTYPPARKSDTLDDFHGTPVPDPYRWMEDVASDETQAWLHAQAALTTPFLDAIPQRAAVKARLTELWNYAKYSVPQKRGERYFYFQNDGLQNQSALVMQEGLDGKAQTVVDPNTFSTDGTVALIDSAISDDGRYVAYTRSISGSDLQDIYVHDVDAGKDLPEVLHWGRFIGLAWKPDNSGFYYNRYPEPGDAPIEDSYLNNKLYFHRVGTAQADDPLIYERPDNSGMRFYPVVSEDGQYLWMLVAEYSGNKNRLYYRPTASDGDFVRLVDDEAAEVQPIGSSGSVFYLHTDRDAPRGRVVAVDVNQPTVWKDVVAQGDDVIANAAVIHHQIAVVYLHDAYHRLVLYHLDGSFDREISLPVMGAIVELSGKQDGDELFINFHSFLYPPAVLRYDFASGKLTTFRDSGLKLNSDAYETRQVFALSKDGTRVPLFLTHKKGLKLDGQNPTLLHAYGGFSLSKTPDFSPSNFYWVEQGGVYALAVLRGGSEYGEEWHQDGMLGNKQNVFDDYIGAAEWLIENGYTSPKKLTIYGRSNGGLLVAACMLQRPDLYGAVLCTVPVADMLRFHKFTAGRFWTFEYGNAEENAEHFRFLYAYSPAHNVKASVTYPPIMVMTAEGDDRVVPMHSLKFTAALQAASAGENPVVLRFEFKAGHGFGKPTTKQIDEFTDMLSFAYWAIGK